MQIYNVWGEEMKIQFVGIKNLKKKNSGCPVCGKKRVSNYSFEASKRMVLPSGRVQLFNIGKTYEVSEKEGRFLLEFTYSLNGNLQYPFMQCD